MMLTDTQRTVALSALTLLILLLMILWMAGAFQSKIKPGTLAGQSAYQGPTLTVERLSVPIVETAAGTIEAKQAGDIGAQVQARIKAIHVKAGDTVKAGDLLITLDDDTMAARTQQAKASINSLNARLGAAEAHYRRTQQLFAKEAATQADLDVAKGDYESLKSQKAAAQSQLKEAGHTLDFTHIRATYPARVIDRYAEPGEIAYPGKKLLTLYDPAVLRIEAYIRESVAVGLKLGQRLEAEVDALKLTLPATIAGIVPAAQPDARNVLIKLRLENRPGLYPGLFVRLRIPQGEEQAVAIPLNYVHQVGQLDVVWLVNNGQIERRFVRLGRPLADGYVKIVSGLSGGEQLVPPERVLPAVAHPK
ncbi:efflux RND transporter periplasmic adaptor subunit [Methylomonas rapida]|uniref:Efflux RND transporter periplasmic adaptor subunit n=1 Tax=Methylomonas rapida TaxID=2963939 RepID=A0ABY7GHV0_9GAMM|nr:efflux RND transporter periplasmic adaptor subunit [Methylomonas rapida]WAR43826.1 efflux RND transporter periplasmic adaptor subunit [Methylomonas rapida]